MVKTARCSPLLDWEQRLGWEGRLKINRQGLKHWGWLVGSLRVGCEITRLERWGTRGSVPLKADQPPLPLHPVLAGSLSTWHKFESLEKREPLLRKCPHRTGLYASLWAIALINNWFGRTRPIGGNATSGLVVLGSVRKRLSKLWGAS